MRRWTKQFVISVALVLGVTGTATGAPGDPSSASTSYMIVEGEIGGNGQFNSASTNFTFNPTTDDGGSSFGETAVGNGASTNFQTNSGFNTTAQPGLTMILNTPSVDLGNLSLVAANTATATFSVSNYTSSKFVVQIWGSTPTYAGHSLTAMTGNAGIGGDASSNGTEQFGLNLVHNTSASAGADPICAVSGFCFGVAGNGATLPYNVDGKFRFFSGETVASGSKTSGLTNYTITFLANQSTVTPAGKYVGALSIVATGTY